MRDERTRALMPFAVIGAGCVVAGGLVSAAIAPSPTEHGAWAAAYLVLVAGAAQIALGAGQGVLAPQPPSDTIVWIEVLGWNLGNAAVIAGTLSGVMGIVDVGGALLVAVLAMLFWATRHETPDAAAVVGARAAWPRLAFGALLVLLLVSIPAGLALAELRG